MGSRHYSRVALAVGMAATAGLGAATSALPASADSAANGSYVLTSGTSQAFPGQTLNIDGNRMGQPGDCFDSPYQLTISYTDFLGRRQSKTDPDKTFATMERAQIQRTAQTPMDAMPSNPAAGPQTVDYSVVVHCGTGTTPVNGIAPVPFDVHSNTLKVTTVFPGQGGAQSSPRSQAAPSSQSQGSSTSQGSSSQAAPTGSVGAPAAGSAAPSAIAPPATPVSGRPTFTG